MKLTLVLLVVCTVTLQLSCAADPDPVVLKRYNAAKGTEKTEKISGMSITFKEINKGKDLVKANPTMKASSNLVLDMWLKDPVVPDKAKTMKSDDPKKKDSVRLDHQGKYGDKKAPYGNFQMQINGKNGKTSIGELQIAKNLAEANPAIFKILMEKSIDNTLGIFVHPKSGL